MKHLQSANSREASIVLKCFVDRWNGIEAIFNNTQVC